MLVREILYSHYQDKAVLCYRFVYQSMSARAGQGDSLPVLCQCLHVLVREILYSHYQDKAVLCYRYRSMSARVSLPVLVTG